MVKFIQSRINQPPGFWRGLVLGVIIFPILFAVGYVAINIARPVIYMWWNSGFDAGFEAGRISAIRDCTAPRYRTCQLPEGVE